MSSQPHDNQQGEHPNRVNFTPVPINFESHAYGRELGYQDLREAGQMSAGVPAGPNPAGDVFEILLVDVDRGNEVLWTSPPVYNAIVQTTTTPEALFASLIPAEQFGPIPRVATTHRGEAAHPDDLENENQHFEVINQVSAEANQMMARLREAIEAARISAEAKIAAATTPAPSAAPSSSAADPASSAADPAAASAPMFAPSSSVADPAATSAPVFAASSPAEGAATSTSSASSSSVGIRQLRPL